MQHNQLQSVHLNELSSKCKSKRELYTFLVSDCHAYMPPQASTNIYFFKQIMRGTKDYIRRDKVLVASVPQIEGLTVEDVLDVFKGNARLLKYLPDERDWAHLDRKWVCDVLYTLDKAAFQQKIDAALKQRRDRLDKARSLQVEIRPEFALALKNCLNFSQENGRASNLLKERSKRKRTREELEEVKNEEAELKEDRHGFLQQVKRMKNQKQELDAMFIGLLPNQNQGVGRMDISGDAQPEQEFQI